MMLKSLSLFLLAAFVLCECLPAQDATQIIEQANERMQGESSKAEMTMQIVRPNWERSVSFKSWSKGEDFSLILITAPARDEGTAFLMRENEIWNWLPDVNRTIKMPPSMMSQSWMGSDFSNNDLVRESSIVTDYTHKLLQDTTINGYDCYRIEMIPKPEAPIVWAKVHTFISKDEYLQLRSEFYDEDDFLVRIMKGSEVKEIGGRLIPTKLEMIPLEDEGNKTIVTYQNLEFNIDISKQFFSIQNMKRLE
ncbi:outer membrane lipoprotein-sorting protein [Gracilimonas sediminicola]|uniref:Outer membrane lipoprotein-sorting protein n=1 Tax=Gracilimonas sediminicola TaxID=2952158 RepID=A0A9X2L1U6_9BACT|nr:outer membrane lipoprotein-sorting protein [Gracilimonas sediminicola]MCP9290734.1 outer membrane lipoprotein-sorting protein [Gracilimonas sediminicola]